MVGSAGQHRSPGDAALRALAGAGGGERRFLRLRSGLRRVARRLDRRRLTALGDDDGIKSALILFTELDSWLTGPLEASLAAGGVALSPSMCSRETEPASFGNVLWTAHAAGKQPVPLWLNWNCAHDGCCGIVLQSRPSAVEVAAIECVGGG